MARKRRLEEQRREAERKANGEYVRLGNLTAILEQNGISENRIQVLTGTRPEEVKRWLEGESMSPENARKIVDEILAKQQRKKDRIARAGI